MENLGKFLISIRIMKHDLILVTWDIGKWNKNSKALNLIYHHVVFLVTNNLSGKHFSDQKTGWPKNKGFSLVQNNLGYIYTIYIDYRLQTTYKPFF